MMSQEEILKKIREDLERVVELGISTDRQKRYHNELSIERRDPDQDERAFADATSGLNLSAVDLAFVKEVVNSGDGR